MDTHQVCCNFADHVFVTRIKEDALMVETPQSVPTAPSMHRHTMRVVLVINVNLDLRDKRPPQNPVEVTHNYLMFL